MNALRGILLKVKTTSKLTARKRGLINVLPHVGLYVPVFKK